MGQKRCRAAARKKDRGHFFATGSLVTYHRILEAWISHGDPNQESLAQVAGEIPIDMLMEKDVLTVEVETTAAEAGTLLEKHKFGSLPVTRNEKLVGIVTERDCTSPCATGDRDGGLTG